MSKFSDNLAARRKYLRLSVAAVTEELAKLGIVRAESTVASWFNGNRGERWNMDELKALLDVLQTDFDTMSSGEVTLVEERLPAATARAMLELSEEQQQLIYTMARSLSKK